MKILHVTNYDNLGGAGIAAYRLHTALRKGGIDSWMLVRTKGSDDPFVSEVRNQRSEIRGQKSENGNRFQRFERLQRARRAFQRLPVRARGWLGTKVTRLLGMEGCSLNIFPTGLHKVLNASDADVIHLHWINNEMISIKEIAKITKPIVWTLHDCWPLLGAEHHSCAKYWQVGHEKHEKAQENSGTTEYTEHTEECLDGINRIDRIQESATDVCEAGDSLANGFEKKSQAIANARITGRTGSQSGCGSFPSLRFLRSFAANKKSVSSAPSVVKENDFSAKGRSASGGNGFNVQRGTECRFNAVAHAVNRCIFRLKKRAWKQLRVHFVAPSNWMAEQVRKSELFADAPVTVIPNCLDLDVFQPLEQLECRRKWNLPLDKKLILFGAYNPLDPNKGLDLLEGALHQLPEETRESMGVVVFGCKGDWNVGGLQTCWLGAIGSEREMAELYNAADCTCVPSRIETLPTVIAESMACGVPCVGFRVGGVPDMIAHEKTGYLAQSFDTEDYATGIRRTLDQRSEVGDRTSSMCRRKAEAMFSEKVVSEKCVAVYKTF